MKTLRSLTVLFIFVLILSSWAPAPAYAKPVSAPSAGSPSLNVDPAKTKPVKLVVNNLTGGTLHVSLSGPAIYSFSTAHRGKTVFTNIKPGMYTITVTTSACPGRLTLKRKMKGTTMLRGITCRRGM